MPLTTDQCLDYDDVHIRQKTTLRSISPDEVATAIDNVVNVVDSITLGSVTVVLSDDYADDIDAAANGIEIGSCYHTSGILKMRLS